MFHYSLMFKIKALLYRKCVNLCFFNVESAIFLLTRNKRGDDEWYC